ncbi:MAG: hypothetical protein OXB84_00115, partial [Halobacteriovoraceae bacterium]|nr:hypothetical protein [Halobacteriovoraceae bacterium]
MKKIVLFFIFIHFSLSYAYTIAFYTDEDPSLAARQHIYAFRHRPPFNEFDITFTIVKVSPEFLGCESKMNNHWKRILLNCDTRTVDAHAQSEGYDVAVIISDSVREGASNAAYGRNGRRIIVTKSTASYAVIHHEYGHVLGFDDEYYCAPKTYYYHGFNTAVIKPQNPYDIDQDARDMYKDDIPWYEFIDPSTPITSSGLLGTPPEFDDEIGLFPNEKCLMEGIYGWIPTKKSIMRASVSDITSWIPLVREAMISARIPKKQNAPTGAVDDWSWFGTYLN